MNDDDKNASGFLFRLPSTCCLPRFQSLHSFINLNNFDLAILFAGQCPVEKKAKATEKQSFVASVTDPSSNFSI